MMGFVSVSNSTTSPSTPISPRCSMSFSSVRSVVLLGISFHPFPFISPLDQVLSNLLHPRHFFYLPRIILAVLIDPICTHTHTLNVVCPHPSLLHLPAVVRLFFIYFDQTIGVCPHSFTTYLRNMTIYIHRIQMHI